MKLFPAEPSCSFRIPVNTVFQTVTTNQSEPDGMKYICPSFYRLINVKWDSKILPFQENLFFNMCIEIYN